MAVHKIAVIGGDGIGPEVIDQAIRAAEAAARKHDRAELKWNQLPWSTAYYKQHGRMLPEDGWEQLAQHDAILFGAVGDPSVPDKITVHELLLPMRRKFDQYVNLRPAYLFDGVPCPLRRQEAGRDRHAGVPREHRGRVRPGRRATSTRAPRTRSRFRPACSPGGAASASCGRRSKPPGSARGRSSPASPSRTRRCTASACGTTCSTRCARTTRTWRAVRCWWTRPRWTSCASRKRSTWWWRATCSATSSPT